MKESAELLVQNLARSMDKGIRTRKSRRSSPCIYGGIQFFYNCPLEMYQELGKMYVDDPRFGVYYDRHGPGLTYSCVMRLHISVIYEKV